MNYRNIISYLSKGLKKKSQILPYVNSIIFEPRGDGRSFTMSFFVPSMNENVQFGILGIDKNFINFLKSPFAPKSSLIPEKAYGYFKDKVLIPSDKMSKKVGDQILQNLKILMNGDKNQIDKYMMDGFNNLELPTIVDLSNLQRNSERNELIGSYKKYLSQSVGRSSEAIPHMASISFRETSK